MRIMMLENDVVSAKHMAELIRLVGHEVVMGRELRLLEDIKRLWPVDLVLTDIFLDDTSGLQIVQEVKTFHPGIKVVAMSGGGIRGNFDYLDYAKEFGADAVVRKPLDAAQITELLGRFAGSGGREPQASFGA